MNHTDTTDSAKPDSAQGQTRRRLNNVIDEGVVDLREVLGIFLTYRWLISSVTVAALLFAVLYSILSTPIYRVDALLQVEEKISSGLSALGDITDILDGQSKTTAEIEILKSRMVMRDVIDKLNLDIEIAPKYFPVIGPAAVRSYEKRQRQKGSEEDLADPLFYADSYAWGGERLSIETLRVPEHLLARKLTLVAAGDNQYQLVGEAGDLLVEGQVGEYSASPGDASIKLYVTELRARPGTEFYVTKYSLPQAVSIVTDMLVVNEKHKNSGILVLTMDGADKQKLGKTLNAIANIYVERNVSRRSAEAQKSLDFLEEQLPVVREQVDTAEKAYESYRILHGSVDLGIETKGVLENILKINSELLTFRQERGELRQNFKEAHPVIKGLDKKISSLENELSKLDGKAARLPKTQQHVLRLERDLQLNTLLYNKLLNTTQELRVAKAGTVGNVRVIDHAVIPDRPIKPKSMLIIALSIVAGAVCGVILSFCHKLIKGGIEDPDELEQKFDIPVYASVMHSENQKQISRKKISDPLLAKNLDDPAIECMRSLRTTLHFKLESASNNIIMICGASPGIGKSFLAANLSGILAENGKKVLLIDADLRRGSLHATFNLAKYGGLSDLVTGRSELSGVIKDTSFDAVKVITAGEYPNNPSELLLHKNVTKVMAAAAKDFDYLVIDTPPILAVSDAAIIGRYAATVLMVLKSNNHTVREIQQSVKKFEQAGVNIDGFVLNDVKSFAAKYGYGGYVYHYDYHG